MPRRPVAFVAFVFVAATAACARDPNENNPWRVTKLDGGGGGGDDAAARVVTVEAVPAMTPAIESLAARETAATVAVLDAISAVPIAHCRAVRTRTLTGTFALSWHPSGKVSGAKVTGFTRAECACVEEALLRAKSPPWSGRRVEGELRL